MYSRETTPNRESIDVFKFYNLSVYGWSFKNSYSALIQNDPIKEAVSKDFAQITGLSYERVRSVFDIDYVYNEHSHKLLLFLYTNKGQQEVFYCFVDPEKPFMMP